MQDIDIQPEDGFEYLGTHRDTCITGRSVCGLVEINVSYSDVRRTARRVEEMIIPGNTEKSKILIMASLRGCLRCSTQLFTGTRPKSEAVDVGVCVYLTQAEGYYNKTLDLSLPEDRLLMFSFMTTIWPGILGEVRMNLFYEATSLTVAMLFSEIAACITDFPNRLLPVELHGSDFFVSSFSFTRFTNNVNFAHWRLQKDLPAFAVLHLLIGPSASIFGSFSFTQMQNAFTSTNNRTAHVMLNDPIFTTTNANNASLLDLILQAKDDLRGQLEALSLFT
jgi:hypothetical protein